MARRRHVAKAFAGVKPGTVLDHYTEVFGVHKGAYRASQMVQMALVAIEYGHDWSASQYADYWAVEERVAFQHRAYAKEVYGDQWRDAVWELAQRAQQADTRSIGKILRLAVA